MIDYDKIAKSVSFYTEHGYTRIEAPWWVGPDCMKITKPKDTSPAYFVEENKKYLVASGEQSFLYMANKGRLPAGKYVTTTPCFRNESIGILSKKCFIKTELIITDDVSKESLTGLIKHCMKFFKLIVPDESKLEIVKTDEGCDIEYDGIEIGSYGIRSCDFLDWIYGTGCAEPRLSRAIIISEK